MPLRLCSIDIRPPLLPEVLTRLSESRSRVMSQTCLVHHETWPAHPAPRAGPSVPTRTRKKAQNEPYKDTDYDYETTWGNPELRAVAAATTKVVGSWWASSASSSPSKTSRAESKGIWESWRATPPRRNSVAKMLESFSSRIRSVILLESFTVAMATALPQSLATYFKHIVEL